MNQPRKTFTAIAAHFSPLTAVKKCSVVWIMLALLLTLCAAQAGPDEDYLNIYSIFTRAEQQEAQGRTSLAHTNYLIAQKDLLLFQQINPNWQPRILAYRFNYLSGKIAATAEKHAAAAGKEVAAVQNHAAPSAKSLVKLLDAGSEPRTVLQLHPAVGDKQVLNMTMKMAMTMSTAGQSMPSVNIPAMVMTMTVEVKDIAANGDIAYEMVFDDATVAADTNAQPMVIAAMKSSLASLKGLTGTGRMSAHGVVKAMQMKLPPTADPQLSQTMDQMKESFSSSSIPLPEEAVGPGAKWEYRIKLKSQGMTIDQLATYELVSVDGDRLTLRSTITQNAANQKIENPAMPGIKVDLDKMTGNGTGDSSFDLGHIMPQSGSLAENMEIIMGMNLGQKKQTMDMKMDMNVTIEAK
jgi:hypothetical protein